MFGTLGPEGVFTQGQSSSDLGLQDDLDYLPSKHLEMSNPLES